jgi:thymidine kinase
MAIYPCDFSGHRYTGPQRSLYLTSLWGDDAETVKLRLCQTHFNELQTRANELLDIVDEASVVSSVCDRCGKEKTGTIFAKWFDQHAEPAYAAADVCATHWQQVRTSLLAASGRAMRGL